MALAADAQSWSDLYLTALSEAGLLRPGDEPPEIRQDSQVVSLMSTLSAGLLGGPAGEKIISDANFTSFFRQVREWYGHDPELKGPFTSPGAEQFDLGLQQPTHFESFDIDVPYCNPVTRQCTTFGRGQLADEDFDAFPLLRSRGIDFSKFFGDEAVLGNLAQLIPPLPAQGQSFLPVGRSLPYTIRFENAADAASRPGEVRVVTELDEHLAPHTFRLGDLRLGDIQVHIPSDRGSFQGEFDFTGSKGFILRVSAGIDTLSHTATWLLQAIDPQTGEVMQDPDVGLLPPNNAQGSGQGFVSYSIQPEHTAATGTEISAQAQVLFDSAPPRETERVTQPIDAQPPQSTVTAERLAEGGSDFQVRWQADDDRGGSGLRHVTVYVSEDEGDFEIWRQRTTETSGVFEGRPGHSYEFLALATDKAGNQEKPDSVADVPGDGTTVNLGDLPGVAETTPQEPAEPAEREPEPSTNPLFLQAKKVIPAPDPPTRPSEFGEVLQPFRAQAFANGIEQSHAGIGPMAIAARPDGSVLVSGGAARNRLFQLPVEGGKVGDPLVELSHPIFDLAFDSEGRLWATTGGGPLLRLDPATGELLSQFGDSLTQSLAVEPETGRLYVSSGDGIEIFDPEGQTFRHFSDVRVGNLAFSPVGTLWAAAWPERGDVVRFDESGEPETMLRFETPVDSLAFGVDGTKLEDLLFVSHNSGELTMVDRATLQRVAIATGGTRGDVVRTTSHGRVLLSQSHQVDAVNPVVAPSVVATNPPHEGFVTLPRGSVTVTFDQDMLVDTASEPGSVLNPDNYRLTGEDAGEIAVEAVVYDAETRTALLTFDALTPDTYSLEVLPSLESAGGAGLPETFSAEFTAVSDFSPLVDLAFDSARSDRQSGTVSYDVTITNTAEHDLVLPMLLVLDPAIWFQGEPVDGVQPPESGTFLIDLTASLDKSALSPGESIRACIRCRFQMKPHSSRPSL